MDEQTKVLDLLEELEDMVEDAKNIPLQPTKIILESEDIFNIIKEIRLALPDDMQQAKWICEERDKVLNSAKTEYDRIIEEAKKQSNFLVEESEITKRASNIGNQIVAEAENYARAIKMKTYNYLDQILFDMQDKIDNINVKYCGEMYNNLASTFDEVAKVLSANRTSVAKLAEKTQSEGLETKAEEK